MVTSLSGHGIAFQVMAREQVKSKSFETIYASKLFLTFLGSGDSVNIFGVDSQVCFVRSLHQHCSVKYLTNLFYASFYLNRELLLLIRKRFFQARSGIFFFIFKCALPRIITCTKNLYQLKYFHSVYDYR